MEIFSANASALGCGFVPSGLSNPPRFVSSTIATTPLDNMAAETQSEAASHLAGEKTAISAPTAEAMAMWVSAARLSMMANVAVKPVAEGKPV